MVSIAKVFRGLIWGLSTIIKINSYPRVITIDIVTDEMTGLPQPTLFEELSHRSFAIQLLIRLSTHSIILRNQNANIGQPYDQGMNIVTIDISTTRSRPDSDPTRSTANADEANLSPSNYVRLKTLNRKLK